MVCYTNVCEQFSADLTTQKSALGVRVDPANCPAFCYRITVTNTGNVTLNSLSVSDDSGLNLSVFPVAAGSGGSARFFSELRDYHQSLL